MRLVHCLSRLEIRIPARTGSEAFPTVLSPLRFSVSKTFCIYLASIDATYVVQKVINEMLKVRVYVHRLLSTLSE